MIVMLADATDPWSMLIHRELCRRDEAVSCVGPEQLLERIRVSWSLLTDGSILSGTLSIDDRSFGLAELSGVFVQLPNPLPLGLDELSPEDRNYVTRETTAAWLALLDILPCAVVNRPVPGGRSTLLSCSLEDAQLAQRHGFTLPPSYCSRNSNEAAARLSDWGRAYVKRVGSSEAGAFIDAADGLGADAMQTAGSLLMQPVPGGQRVTVYLVAGEPVGTVIQPEAATGGTEVPLRLPTALCVNLAKDLGLTFAQMELVVSAGDIYCLDVSPSPHFWRCPQDIQQRIVESLADYLSQPRSMPSHDSLVGTHGGFGPR